ncbi:hypothetical protein Scep_012632 [Stephania cephalantha]|uniref:Uncharacterized protein n=1 Tax=Stephania cephalantha TaxID=152367 RepID=A0AAP0P7Q5_9MAGN
MASLSRLRLTTTTTASLSTLLRHHLSSILSPDSAAFLTSKQKSRLALSLLKHETNPERIINICRASFLVPSLSLMRFDRMSLWFEKTNSTSSAVCV